MTEGSKGRGGQAGVAIVCRTLALAGDAAGRDAARAVQCLAELPGVTAVEAAGGGRLRVTYDALRTEYRSLVSALNGAGFRTGTGRWESLRAAWFGFLDRNVRSNAAARGGACCSRPDDIYANRR